MLNTEKGRKVVSFLEKAKTKIAGIYTFLFVMWITATPVYASGADIGSVTTGVMQLLGWGVGALGAFFAVIGVIMFFIGRAQDDSNQQNKGTNMIVGGIVLIALGVAIHGIGGDIFGSPPTISF
ncbi:MAG: hypothetical protein FWG63_08265 [Defluviitaleaceae bacterium]|nr:hypothetical protein [Defluviitaleaceae bacterium]